MDSVTQKQSKPKGKLIPGYGDKYIVTRDGQVFDTRRGVYVAQASNGLGYMHLHLSYRELRKHCYIHRLVAMAYIGQPPEGKPQVNHKDMNKGNNHVDNLEWVSSQENHHHWMKKKGRFTGPRLTVDDLVKSGIPRDVAEYALS